MGEVRASPVQHLAVKGMRPLESADEVSYHMIEAAHAALNLQKNSAGRQTDPSTPASKKEHAVASATSADNDLTPEKKQPGAPIVEGDPSAVAAAVEAVAT